MRRRKQLILMISVVIMMFALFGCGRPKYKLNLDSSGFQSRKTQYRAGETVTVYFDAIATDTNYRFRLDDSSVEMTQSYDAGHGYVFTFTMPDHEVSLSCESYNSMLPYTTIAVTFDNEVADADVWILPQTEKNLETSLWGRATVGKLGAGKTKEVYLTEFDPAQTWLVRIIDVDHAYYSADDLKLGDGFQIVFRSDDSRYDSVIEVLDRDGTVLSSAKAFTGMLGAE